MNLHQLYQFMLVAEEGSVTRGAERAAISQPAVSRAVADLENAVGELLFDRGSRGVTPTEAGRTLLEYARRIFALEREAEEALSDLRELGTGRLAIGASTTIGDHLLPSVVAEYLQTYSGIELSMEVANTEAIQEGVSSGRYDVGFTEGRVDGERFEMRPIAEDRLVVIAAPGHPLMGVTVGVERIAGESFVMREAGSGTRDVVETGFRQAGIVPRVACNFGSTAAIKMVVAAGLGLGVVSELAIRGEVARGELVVLDTPLRLSRRFHLIRLGWRRESVAFRAFGRMLERRLVLDGVLRDE